MATAATQQTIDNYLKALLSFGNYAEYLADDITLKFMGTDMEIAGIEGVRQFIDLVHQEAFRTDIQVKKVAYSENTALLELDFRGTHIGEFQGVSATDREVSVPYAAAYDLERDKIKALRLYFPLELLMSQITSGDNRQ